LLIAAGGDVSREVRGDDETAEERPIMPPALARGFLEAILDALDSMRFDVPGGALAGYYKGEPRATSKDGRGLFGHFLRAFGFPTAQRVRRALARFGCGPPGSGLDPETVAAAVAAGVPGTNPAAVLRIARCGL
jgi:hypothetical protein